MTYYLKSPVVENRKVNKDVYTGLELSKSRRSQNQFKDPAYVANGRNKLLNALT